MIIILSVQSQEAKIKISKGNKEMMAMDWT